MAFSESGTLDGFPCIFVWDATTLRKLNQIAISDTYLINVEFSPMSNMLLVISSDSLEGPCRSTIAVWDFLEGCRDVFCKSMIPKRITDAKWNRFTGVDVSEFVTVCSDEYHYWRVTNNLKLQFQEGHIEQKHKNEGSLTCVEFLVPSPTCVSSYLALGTSHGYVWVADVRTN